MALQPATVAVNGSVPVYKIDSASVIFTDSNATVFAVARELKQLNGLQFSFTKQLSEGTAISFTTDKPVKLLVGYFASKEAQYAKAPELETNATANDYGQADAKIANGIIIKGMPPVNIR